MFLSKVRLAGKRNPYDIHREIWGLFPGMPDAERPFLYRVFWPRRGLPTEALVQSDVSPVDSNSSSCSLMAKKEFDPKLRKGQVLRFALCANPTKRLAEERKRVPLIHEDHQLAWLERKTEPFAELLEAQVAGGRVLNFMRHGVAGKIAAVDFTGVLQVGDPPGIGDALRNGIGPAKAFGCGLLSLARA
ncbi:MAG: type I-E CRISPR-associated protein Cas6/Cse3/CasE [Polyangia bacterium]